MGLGGYMCWTAVAREIKQRYGRLAIPAEQHGHHLHYIVSPAFTNNPNIAPAESMFGDDVRMLLNSAAANYCKHDAPDRAIHRTDKHIIAQYCEQYGIYDPQLKCDFYPLRSEEQAVIGIIDRIGKPFIAIEPMSKTNYTVNRVYPFDKWQAFVNALIADGHTIVQVGSRGSSVLDGVVNLVGMTTFREAIELLRHAQLFAAAESGLVHAATAVETTSLCVVTGYQSMKMVCYPQNINVNIASHGPCGMKIRCDECARDADNHDVDELIMLARGFLS